MPNFYILYTKEANHPMKNLFHHKDYPIILTMILRKKGIKTSHRGQTSLG